LNGSVGAGGYINFYNTNDYALGKWGTDETLKPDLGFSYFLAQFWRGTIPTTPLYFPTNTYEIFAFCDPAPSYALGAQPNVDGAFGGLQIDLPTIWPIDLLGKEDYSSHFWHSAEFRGDYPPQVNFWRTILGAQGFNLQ
jgi:hypothetical protein